MKTLFKSLLVALTLTVVSFSVAQAETGKLVSRPKKVAAFQSGIYTTTEGKVQIAVNKEVGGWVTVRLTNAEGKELFVQDIAKNRQTARMRLDVSNLPDGTYQVEISNGQEATKHALTLNTQKPGLPTRFIAIN